MSTQWLYFVYGLCIMSYFMMAWFFYRKDGELLSRLVAVLMLVLGLQCLKDLFFIHPSDSQDLTDWMVMTAIDMVAVPLYAFILIELCRPGTLTRRIIILHELSFIVPIALFGITHIRIFYYILVGWAIIYGLGYATKTFVDIPRYHALLKQRFSYEDNVNLNWLRVILASFFAVFTLWIADCMISHLTLEVGYLGGSLVMWMFIYYFLYKHESVMNELSEKVLTDTLDVVESGLSDIGKRIIELFDRDRIWLNPNLKLSDVARAAGTNRTYVSAYFNAESGSNFYDFVNRYRIDHACRLLSSSSDSLKLIAEQSGFNSQQSFIRVFNKVKGMTPSEYRGGVIG